MTAVLAWFASSRLGRWLGAVGLVLIAIAGVYFKGRSDAKRAKEREAALAELRARRVRDEIDRDVGGAVGGAVRDRLRSWER